MDALRHEMIHVIICVQAKKRERKTEQNYYEKKVETKTATDVFFYLNRFSIMHEAKKRVVNRKLPA